MDDFAVRHLFQMIGHADPARALCSNAAGSASPLGPWSTQARMAAAITPAMTTDAATPLDVSLFASESSMPKMSVPEFLAFYIGSGYAASLGSSAFGLALRSAVP